MTDRATEQLGERRRLQFKFNQRHRKTFAESIKEPEVLKNLFYLAF